MINVDKLQFELTELETKTLEALIDGLYAEPGFSDVDAQDLSKATSIPIKQIRGVLASLVKKGIVDMGDWTTNGQTWALIYLKPQYWFLHPEWQVECVLKNAMDRLAEAFNGQ